MYYFIFIYIMTFTLQILFLFIPIKEKNHFANVWVLYLHTVKEKKKEIHIKQNKTKQEHYGFMDLLWTQRIMADF